MFKRRRSRKSNPFFALQAIGSREVQEDTIVVAQDSVSGDYRHPDCFIVADGMGGHARGDVASKAAAEAALRAFENASTFSTRLLFDSVSIANKKIDELCRSDEKLEGMGTTILICVFSAGRLYWISVGDSPLFGVDTNYKIERLNADHSMKPVIEALAENGAFEEGSAGSNLKATQLRSALQGTTVEMFDLADQGLSLDSWNYIILGSDGLESLTTTEIESICRARGKNRAREVALSLVAAVEDKNLASQDNVSSIVINARSFRS